MSGSSPPPDNSLQVEQSREQDAATQRAQAKADADAASAKLGALRTSSRSSANPSVDSYFQGQGVDPSQFEGQINSQLDAMLGGISPDDPNPGAAFNNAGSTIYQNLTTGAQAKGQRDLDKLFAPNFETTRVPFTLDDPYLAGINAQQRSSADEIIRNMLNRGVITQTGFDAGESDLNNQNANVMARLNEAGTGVLADEQNSLRDIANKGRTAASGLTLGQPFDAQSYGNQADSQFNDFISKLGDTIRGKIGTGNLYSTTGLAGVAGAAQGAGNTAFNPSAASGVITDPNDPNDPKNRTTTPAASGSIF